MIIISGWVRSAHRGPRASLRRKIRDGYDLFVMRVRARGVCVRRVRDADRLVYIGIIRTYTNVMNVLVRVYLYKSRFNTNANNIMRTHVRRYRSGDNSVFYLFFFFITV